MTATAPVSLDNDLMFLLSWASHALATEQTAGLSGLGITPRAYCVLVKAMAADTTQTQLAQLCGLDKTTMVATMDELERLQLAERRPSATDRRVRIIAVTPKGRRLVAKAADIVSQIQDDVLSALPVENRRILMDSLAQLVDGRLASLVPCERAPRRRERRLA
ncbi:MarR family winged helix-turn-helix transcriptional regulator [Micromonospora sp. NPDC049903]|uniref:MarR family winged helix-turn-helix transcriptional regulator n=1 Tax=Micromonospora sp. NPDC049903 TaxID=3364276 RepID=UPI0037A37888